MRPTIAPAMRADGTRHHTPADRQGCFMFWGVVARMTVATVPPLAPQTDR
jgi:hypothetical protein